MHTHTLVIVQLMRPGIIGMFIIHSFIQCQYTNIHTFTTHTHQVKEVYVKENDSIGEDEVILEFYPEEQN